MLYTQHGFKKGFALLAARSLSLQWKSKTNRTLLSKNCCSFKCNFHSHREIPVLVMTAQKLKYLEYHNIPFTF